MHTIRNTVDKRPSYYLAFNEKNEKVISLNQMHKKTRSPMTGKVMMNAFYLLEIYSSLKKADMIDASSNANLGNPVKCTNFRPA